MHFRYRWQIQGGHVHIDVFIGQSPNHTLGNAGHLCMSRPEWETLRDILEFPELPDDVTHDFVESKT